MIVIDHRPESRWAWYADEDRDMARAWEAVAARGSRRMQAYEAVQRFDRYQDLRDRFAALGDESHQRIAALEGRALIEIPMPYAIALL
jgi:hypothetical protein